jgi:hypothetical protein
LICIVQNGVNIRIWKTLNNLMSSAEKKSLEIQLNCMKAVSGNQDGIIRHGCVQNLHSSIIRE